MRQKVHAMKACKPLFKNKFDFSNGNLYRKKSKYIICFQVTRSQRKFKHIIFFASSDTYQGSSVLSDTKYKNNTVLLL